MKKTHKEVPRLLLLFACCMTLIMPRLTAQTGTTCATAISITDSYNNNSLTGSDAVVWYTFTATRGDGQIQLMVNSLPCYSSIKLYSGNCAGLVLRDTSKFETFGYVIDYTSLTVSSTYYIKIEKSGTSVALYGLAVIGSISSVTCSNCYPTTCDLVCNNSFENCSSDPNNASQINKIYCWGNAGGSTTGTSDYFNNNTSLSYDVPNNIAGYESPRTGNSYAGIITYTTATSNQVCEWHEYITGRFNTPLVAGQIYRISFWTSLADNSGFVGGKLGAYVSTAIPTQPCHGTIPVTPQVVNPTVITQSNGWTQVTGTFTATGGEQYITIGSFVSYASSGVSVHTPDSMTSYTPTCAYYFIDDVSVKEEPLITVTSNPNGWVCAGTPTTFTASSSGGSVTTYSWSPSQGSVTCLNPTLCSQVYSANSYTAATTYTLTCTLPSGCTTTATYTYAQLAAPLTLNAGADQSICLGPSVVLSATVTGTYNSSSWAILNSSTLCSGCTSTTVTPTTTTQYVYTATQTTTGCTKKDTVTVTVTPLPVTIVSPPGATTCGGCFGFTTNPVGATYSWGIGNSVSSSCPTCATFNACWGTPFDTTGVTGHITVSIVDANGCRGSAVGYIPSCCPFKDGQEYVYPNLVNDSTTRVDNVSYPSLFWYNTATQYYEAGHKELSINGTFIVDRNTRFKGCEIKMGPNAKIIVRPGIKLEFTDTAAFDSKVYACSDQWYGIEVDGTNASSKVTVLNGTTIEDAKNAIVSINGGNFFIDGGNSTNKFNKNNIGVLIKAYTGAHPGVIRKTIFACDAPGQPGSTAGVTSAGANCRAPVSGKGFAGVYVESCTNVIIGDSTSLVHRNLFERTQFGVYSKNSNVKIWNNDFKYFTTTVVAPNVPANGIAVYATATKQNPKALTVGRTGNYKAKNKFTKCSYGVMAHNYIDLSCEFNRFDSCMTKGIYTLNCLSRTVLINADTLTECVGINIACVESNNSTVTITNNSINSTQAYVANNFGNTGIYVVNAVLVNVNLKIQYNSVKKMRNGIWVSRVNKAKITDNNPITFMSGQPMTQLAPCIGIKLEEVTNSMIRQNQVGFNSNPTAAQHATLFGIHMTNCKNDTVSKNLLLKVGSGIFLKGTCNPSILACNSMTNCYYGVNFNYLNGYTTPVSVNHQITWGSSTAFHTTGNTWTGTMAGGFDLRGRIMPININGIKWYYPNATTPPTSSMFLNSLYGNVLQDTTTGDKCSQMLAPPAQTQEQTRNYTLAGICKTPRTYDTLNSAFQYHDNVFAYRMLRENPSWKSLGTADDSYYANFYTTHTSGNIGKFADVEDDIASGNVSSATSTLSSITPSGQYEVNRKAMLEVYLQTWAIDSMNLDSAQQAVLLGIINQGTLTGGTSVFDARNMLNEEVHDSTNLRMQNSTFTASTPHAVSPVYPNPTNGQLSIDIALEQDVPGVFELFDLSGRLVGAWQFTGGQRKYTFDVSFLPSGTYIYCVRMEGEMLKSDRIIIIKE